MCGKKDGIERAGEQVVKGMIAGKDEGVEGCGHAWLLRRLATGGGEFG